MKGSSTKSQFGRNSIAAIVQVVISGATTFLLYWFLARSIGLADIGVWSVVMAATSTTSIANLGIASSTVKFVAKYNAVDMEARAVDVIITSATSIFVVIGICALVMLPVFGWVLPSFLVEDKIDVGLTVLPYALASFWLNSISASLYSSLDGYHRIDLRSGLLIFSSLLFLGLAFLLVPQLGLVGLARAQLAQAVLVLVTSTLLVRRVVSSKYSLFRKWSRSTFQEIINYSVQFQVIAVSRMLVEPVTKFFLAKFGNLEITGLFEMGSKIVIQLRTICATAFQAFVPKIAEIHELEMNGVSRFYLRAFEFTVVLSILFFCFTLAESGPLSVIWLGYVDSHFVLFVCLTATAWTINILSSPAYYFNLGTGELRGNVIGHLASAIANIFFGLILGIGFSAIGVVVGYAVSIALGALITIVIYHRKQQHAPVDILGGNLVLLTTAATLGLLLALTLFTIFGSKLQGAVSAFMVSIVLGLATIVPLWRHPLREEVWGILKIARQSSG